MPATLIEGTAKTDSRGYLKFSVGSIPANTPVAVELFSERASTIPAQLSVVADAVGQKDLDVEQPPGGGCPGRFDGRGDAEQLGDL